MTVVGNYQRDIGRLRFVAIVAGGVVLINMDSLPAEIILRRAIAVGFK